MALPRTDERWGFRLSRNELAAIGAGLAVAAVVVALAALSAVVTDHDAAYFTAEAQATLDAPWYVGWASIVGGFAWWSAGVGALIAALLVRRRGVRLDLLAYGFAALLSFQLALDDVLRLHDVVFPEFGLGERKVDAGYFAAYALYAWLSREVWKRHGWVALAAALGLLGASIAADQFIVVFGGEETPLLEEGLKLAGAFVWAAAQIRFALREALDSALLS